MDRYEPQQIEAKWQRVWADERAFHVDNPDPDAPPEGDAPHVELRASTMSGDVEVIRA